MAVRIGALTEKPDQPQEGAFDLKLTTRDDLLSEPVDAYGRLDAFMRLVTGPLINALVSPLNLHPIRPEGRTT